jgi:hypothetical protein
VAARYESTDSEKPSVILAGFSVENMAIEPIVESSLETETLGARVAAAFGPGKNPPLVIAPSDSRFIDDDQQIQLDKVVLRYVGGGTITLNQLMAAIRPLIEEQFDDAIEGAFAPIASTPTWQNARALVKLMEGPGATDLRYTLDLATSSSSTAFFNNSPFFRARIRSNTAGLALVTGRLNLAGFGTGIDSVLVWSLPALQSVTVDPGSLAINRAAQPAPGPALRAVAEVSPASATVSLPAGYTSATQALAALTPDGFTGSFIRNGFRFSIAGAIGASGQSIELANLRFAFDAPNIQTDFFKTRWSTVDSSVAALGAQGAFEQHVVHQNQAGTTTIDVRIEIDGLGIANGQAPVEVCDCPLPASAWLITPAVGVPGSHAPPAEPASKWTLWLPASAGRTSDLSGTLGAMR